jgi:hypothetical protein
MTKSTTSSSFVADPKFPVSVINLGNVSTILPVYSTTLGITKLDIVVSSQITIATTSTILPIIGSVMEIHGVDSSHKACKNSKFHGG